jgi:hypothetical protein
LCGEPRGADADVDDAAAAAKIAALIEACFGPAPTRIRANTSRWLKVYRCAGEPRPKRVIKLSVGKIEFLGRGQQFVGFGEHPSGVPYQWRDVSLDEVPLDDLPAITEEQEIAFQKAAEARWPLPTKSEEEETPGRPNGAGRADFHNTCFAEDVVEALDVLPNDYADRAMWVKFGMAAYAGGASFEAFDRWSRKWHGYNEGATRAAWKSFAKTHSVTAASLFEEVFRRVPGWKKPSERNGRPGEDWESEDYSFGAASKPPDKDALLSEVKTMRFDPLKWVAPPFIVEGVTIIASNPKMGKSWLCWQLGIAVAEGRPVFRDCDPCEAGDVLYLALEDNMRRVQQRATKILGIGRDWPECMRVRCEIELAHEGGIARIRNWAKSVAKPRLVIIDVFDFFRKPFSGRGSSYHEDLAAIGELRALAAELRMAIVVIHHNRKGGAEIDPFEVVSGTMGLTGGADTVLVIRRDEQGVVGLYGRGRDLPQDVETAFTFNRDTAQWQLAGAIDEARATGERKAILEALAASDESMPPKDIAAILKKSPGTISALLRRMLKMEPPPVRKIGHGRYTLAGKVVSDDLAAGTAYRSARDAE